MVEGALGGHDALGHGELQPLRRADGHRAFADLDVVVRPHRDPLGQRDRGTQRSASALREMTLASCVCFSRAILTSTRSATTWQLVRSSLSEIATAEPMRLSALTL